MVWTEISRHFPDGNRSPSGTDAPFVDLAAGPWGSTRYSTLHAQAAEDHSCHGHLALLILTRLVWAPCAAPRTARSCGSPSRPSWRWRPSRCSCSPTRPSWATSAPSRSPGLGIAAVVLQTVVGLCVFLAYGTTASVARHLGAGDTRGALAQGIDGIWLAVLIGAVATVLGVALTDPLVGAFGAGARGHRAGHDLPADRVPRHHAAAGHARRHRGAARPAGHPDPALRRGGRQRPQHRAQPAGWSTAPTSGSPAPRGARCSHRSRAPACSPPSWSGAPGARVHRCGRTDPGSGPPPAPGSRSWSAPSRCAPRCWSRRTP